MRGTRFIVAALSCAALVAILGEPVAAEFTSDFMPQRVRDAQGYTFLERSIAFPVAITPDIGLHSSNSLSSGCSPEASSENGRPTIRVGEDGWTYTYQGGTEFVTWTTVLALPF